jgi:hypothetical protein
MRTVIDVSRDLTVSVIHAAPRMLMAGNACERGKVTGILMALRTGCPCSVMMPGVDREVWPVMVERGRCPRRGRMTRCARRGESCRLMIRICRPVVIGLVTEIAIRGRALILSVNVAQIARRIHMRSGQRECRICMIERRRIPRRCCVARETIVIKLPRHMVRICHAVEIGLMT